jgi:membrane carboxypeptidase/penicillin-binding protein
MLELYFNYVEWGKGVYGMRLPPAQYYNKSTANLARAILRIACNSYKPGEIYTPSYAKSASAREGMSFLSAISSRQPPCHGREVFVSHLG